MIRFSAALASSSVCNENMPRVDFGLGLLRLGRLVVGGLDRRVGGGRFRDLLEHALHQQFFAVIGEFLGEFRGLVDLFGKRLLRHQFAVDQKVEKIAVAGLAFELRRQAGAKIAGGDLHIVVGDLLAVDRGEHLGRRREGGNNRKRGHGQHARQTGGFVTRVFRQEHEILAPG